MDISKAGNTAWAIGLTRSQATGEPDYLDFSGSRATRNQNLFGDFVVGAFSTTTNTRNIRVLHAVYDTTAPYYTTDKPLAMREVDYAGGDGSLDDIYSWSSNFSTGRQFTKVRLTVNNEKVTADLFDSLADGGTGAWVTLVTSTGDKGTIFKPVADTCRTMYPMAFISSSQGGTPPGARQLTIEQYRYGLRADGLVGIPCS